MKTYSKKKNSSFENQMYSSLLAFVELSSWSSEEGVRYMAQVSPSRRKRGTGGWLDVNPHYNNQAATAIIEMDIMWRGKIINVEQGI